MADLPLCPKCGEPLDPACGDDESRLCSNCRKPTVTLADLEIAIFASGDDPGRLQQWPAIQSLLSERFGYGLDPAVLLERFTGLLQSRLGMTAEQYLTIPLSDFADLLGQLEAGEVPPTAKSSDPPKGTKRTAKDGKVSERTEQNIKAALLKLGRDATQEEVAAEAHVSAKTVSRSMAWKCRASLWGSRGDAVSLDDTAMIDVRDGTERFLEKHRDSLQHKTLAKLQRVEADSDLMERLVLELHSVDEQTPLAEMSVEIAKETIRSSLERATEKRTFTGHLP